ncbi:MAG TPA: AarF/UbiB family protein [Arachnia sp.]|nr:AarF/UbiB family protein [Arachnia sp.]HMT86262.1 AarF/UbiB family protein [Arachnia sp.]
MFDLEFGRDAHRAREILGVFRRYGIAERSARESDDGEIPVEQPQAAEDVETLTSGQRLCAAFAELGTTWIKLGQSLSMRADLVGAEIAHALEGLQTTVPADPPGAAIATVERDLQRPISALFARFDAEPFASGSVAQAHRAVLLDGTDVVVKVIHDGAPERVRSDLALMTRLAAFAERVDPEIARYDPTTIVRHFAAMMENAVDLRHELTYMQRLAKDLEELDWLRVPRAYTELCSQSVLTMEAMAGSPVRTAADVEAAGWTVNDMTTKVTELWLEMIFSNGLYHADPHPGNFLIADPETLVLLDYGDVGFLPESGRQDVARLLLAVTTRDVPGLTDVLLEICHAPATTDTHALENAVDTWLTNHLPAHSATGDRDLNAAMTAGMEVLHRFELRFPSDLAMLLRVLARLEGFGAQLGSTMTPEELLGPFLRRLTLQQNDLSHIAQRLMRVVAGWGRLARDIPRDLSGLLQQLRMGEARVEINLRDPDGLVDDVVDGLAASASLLGASHLIASGTGPKVKGVSLPGLAAAAFSAVTWWKLTSRRRGHRTAEQKAAALIRRLRRR